MQLSASIRVARPVAAVFAWVTQPERLEPLVGVETIPMLASAPTTTISIAGPLAPGTQISYLITAPSGATRETVLEVSAFAPPTTFAVRSLQDPIGMTVRYDLEAADAGTDLTLTWTLAPTGAGGALAARLGMLVTQRRIGQLMASLKIAIEAEQNKDE